MSSYPGTTSSYQRPGMRVPFRVVIGLIIAGVAIVSYFGKMQKNPVTGKSQAIPWTIEQEIALGMNSAPQMAAEFGGESTDKHYRQLVEQVGARIVGSLPPEARAADGTQVYPYSYHVLADTKTVNAFALPGGQVFITEALLKRLESEGQLAGVLGHETGHVLGRHSAAQAAKSDLLQGLVGATTVAASNSRDGGQMAQMASAMAANMLTLKYSRGDELQADQLGLKFMYLAGYDPRSMIRVMEILEEASGGANNSRPEFSSTHPNPGHRIERIKEELGTMFPNGVPEGLKK
jgi:beta-barrel assembly-enhancing protease